jgi:hypothetical protein
MQTDEFPVEERLCLWCEHLVMCPPGPVCDGAYTWDSGGLYCDYHPSTQDLFHIMGANQPLHVDLKFAMQCKHFTPKKELYGK